MEGGLKRKQSRAKIWSVLKEIDQGYLGRCQSTLKQWHETGRQMRDKSFATLKVYLAARALGCGANWVVRMMGRASGVELTQEEEVETGPVTYLAYVMVVQLQQLDVETAKHIVLSIIRENEEQYCLLRDEHMKRPDTSHSVKKWFQILELSMAGNALWSIHARRHHLNVRNPYKRPSEVPSEGLQIMQLKPDTRKTEKTRAQNRPLGTNKTNTAYENLETLDETVLWKPYEYITSLPSKGFRQHLIDALQTWFNVAGSSLVAIPGQRPCSMKHP
ncbi:hypothetical protein BDV10DRAFT_186458 [Aspergillus recurvatus]